MKFTYSWLKEHLDTTASPQEIAEKVTALGLELYSFCDCMKLSNLASVKRNQRLESARNLE